MFKQRLSDPKLKSLYSELKIHDKEEAAWKRLRSEGKDKDGLKEAELRKKLLGIMDVYNLLENFEDGHKRKKDPSEYNETNEDHINKSMFKDKKLNKLWAKAEVAGFTSPELAALKEEFDHHEAKINEYYSILSETKDGGRKHDKEADDENSIDDTLERFNTLEAADEMHENAQAKKEKRVDYLEKVQLLREHHRGLKDGYDRLHRLTATGPNSKEFIEPKVQGLWKVALESDFTHEELESLRIELMHYENRLLKLRHLHHEALLHEETHKEKVASAGEKTNGLLLLQDNIKKQARKVEKLHMELETKILMKHIEL